MSPCRLNPSVVCFLAVCTWLVMTWTVVKEVDGHGYMRVPPGRSTAWRESQVNFHINYNDNANYCGGFSTQHDINNGSCGICGDDFRTPVPRDNERGGFYDTGNIVREYAKGAVIEASIVITANHLGKFYFDIFPSNDPNEPEQEELFLPLYNAETGTTYYVIDNTARTFIVKLKLPDNLVCSNCVLRWKYVAGNNNGCNSPGDCCLGCGNQEQFYSCADVMITEDGKQGLPTWVEPDKTPRSTPAAVAATSSPTTPATTTSKPTTTTTKPTTTTTTTTTKPTTTTTTTTTKPTTTTTTTTTASKLTTTTPKATTTTRTPTTTTTTTTTTTSSANTQRPTTKAPSCSAYCIALCKPQQRSPFCFKQQCETCPLYKEILNK